jgi:hypothetical protein
MIRDKVRTDRQWILWGGEPNPARAGSGRHLRVDMLIKFNRKTVADYLAAGGNPQTLRNCIKVEFCYLLEKRPVSLVILSALEGAENGLLPVELEPILRAADEGVELIPAAIRKLTLAFHIKLYRDGRIAITRNGRRCLEKARKEAALRALKIERVFDAQREVSRSVARRGRK